MNIIRKLRNFPQNNGGVELCNLLFSFNVACVAVYPNTHNGNNNHPCQRKGSGRVNNSNSFRQLNMSKDHGVDKW